MEEETRIKGEQLGDSCENPSKRCGGLDRVSSSLRSGWKGPVSELFCRETQLVFLIV